MLQLILVTLIPWIELRGSIRIGISQGLDPFLVFFVCTATNILLIPVLLVFLELVTPHIENIDFVRTHLTNTRNRAKKFIDRHGTLGLAVFVAVPLPGTGAYTGALAAYVFGIKKHEALPAIALGVLVAGVLVTFISTGAFKLLLSMLQ